MITIGTHCFRSPCQQPPKFYCCDPQLPACRSCSQIECLRCRRERNKPLKKLIAQQKQSNIGNKCFVCSQTNKTEGVTFSCSHFTCLECICKEVCRRIKSNEWMKLVKKENQTISCQCVDNCYENINSLLQKYCFCCGQLFQNSKYIVLNNGLKFRKVCKNNIKYQNQQEPESSPKLTQQIIQKLTKPKEQPSNNMYKDLLVNQETNRPNKIKNIIHQKDQTHELTPINKHLYQKSRAKQEERKEIEMEIEKVSFKKKKIEQEKMCIICNNYTVRLHSEGYHLGICQICNNNNKYMFQRLQYQKSQGNSTKLEEKNAPRTHSNPKKEKTEAKKEHLPKINCQDRIEDSIKNSKNTEESSIKCFDCGKLKPLTDLKKIPDLDSYLCSKCEGIQSNFLSNSAKKKKQLEQDLTGFSYFLTKQRQKFIFGRNVRYQHKEFQFQLSKKVSKKREILPSILQEQPDPINMEFFMDVSDKISCFQCGLFMEQPEMMLKLGRQFCLSCFMMKK